MSVKHYSRFDELIDRLSSIAALPRGSTFSFNNGRMVICPRSLGTSLRRLYGGQNRDDIIVEIRKRVTDACEYVDDTIRTRSFTDLWQIEREQCMVRLCNILAEIPIGLSNLSNYPDYVPDPNMQQQIASCIRDVKQVLSRMATQDWHPDASVVLSSVGVGDAGSASSVAEILPNLASFVSGATSSLASAASSMASIAQGLGTSQGVAAATDELELESAGADAEFAAE